MCVVKVLDKLLIVWYSFFFVLFLNRFGLIFFLVLFKSFWFFFVKLIICVKVFIDGLKFWFLKWFFKIFVEVNNFDKLVCLVDIIVLIMLWWIFFVINNWCKWVFINLMIFVCFLFSKMLYFLIFWFIVLLIFVCNWINGKV